MLQFYVGLLGLRLVSDVQTSPSIGRRIHISPHGYRIARLQTSYGERIKLIESNVPPHQNPKCDYVYECRGYAYLTFIVSNIDEICEQLTRSKIEIISDGLVPVRENVLACFVKDPEGNFLEFVDYPDIVSYRPDIYGAEIISAGDR
jgi:catechol 2,3-dioxygenase-like lactoylglutathione lyase family enzyme